MKRFGYDIVTVDIQWYEPNADLTKLDDATLALLIAVDQDSSGNRELLQRDGFIGWIADVPGSPEKYVALFNTRPLPGQLDFARAAFSSPNVNRDTRGLGTAIDLDVTGAKKLYLVVEDGHTGNGQLDIVWAEPTLTTATGAIKLTSLPWVSATSGRGTQASIDKGATGKDLIVAGKPAAFGIGARQRSVIEFDLPAGATRFRAFAGIDDVNSPSRNVGLHAPSIQFFVFTSSPYATDASAAVAVKLPEIGLGESVRIRDLWKKSDLGTFTDAFAPVLPSHGAGLYRVSPGN